MNNRNDMLNILLACVLGLVLAAFVLVRTFLPWFIIPELNATNMVLICLVALVLDHYLAPGAKRCYVCVLLLGGLTFGLLPWAACFVGAMEALKLGLTGGAVCAVTTALYSSVQDRLSSGPAAKAAPVMSALGLFLAAQILTGLL